MKPSVTPAWLAAFALALVTPVAGAAQSLYAGVGPSFPMSDYGDYAKTGFLAVAGVEFGLGDGPLRLFGEGFYGQNSHEDLSVGSVTVEGGKTNPLGAMGGLLVNLGSDDGPGVYFFGQAGIMVHKYSPPEGEGDSESAIGFGGGGGVTFPLAGLTAFAEGRFLTASFDGEEGVSESETTAFAAAVVGLAFPLGGGE